MTPQFWHFAVFLACFAVSAESACRNVKSSPIGCIKTNHTLRCYYAIPESLTWHEAKEQCECTGRKLADFSEGPLYNNLEITKAQNVWINGRENVLGRWQFTTGINYTDPISDSAHCARLSLDGSGADYDISPQDCPTALPYACRKKTCNDTIVSKLNCFAFSPDNEAVDWFEARRRCLANDSILAWKRPQERFRLSFDFFFRAIANIPAQKLMWIGLRNSVWEWAGAGNAVTEMIQTKFPSGQPTGVAVPNCLQLDANNSWIVEMCNQTAWGLCEQENDSVPIEVSTNTPIPLVAGQQVTFLCNFKNYPSDSPKSIIWTFQNESGSSEEVLYDSKNPNTYLGLWKTRASHILSTMDLRIIVNDVQPHHTGNYTCTINDGYHVNKKSLEVEVSGITTTARPLTTRPPGPRCAAGHNCQNNASCFIIADVNTCYCTPCFTGDTCTIRHQDLCSSAPCQNGGKCTTDCVTYQCQCAFGFQGSNCQISCTNTRSITPKRSAPLGGRAEYYCDPLFPSPVITWRKEGSTTVLSNTRNLTINPVKKESAGTYYCEVISASCMERRSTELETQYTITPNTTENTNSALTLGDTLRSSCEASGSPIPSVYWKFISSNGATLKKTTEQEKKSELVILGVQIADNGVYQCMATYKGEELAVIKRQEVAVTDPNQSSVSSMSSSSTTTVVTPGSGASTGGGQSNTQWNVLLIVIICLLIIAIIVMIVVLCIKVKPGRKVSVSEEHDAERDEVPRKESNAVTTSVMMHTSAAIPPESEGSMKRLNEDEEKPAEAENGVSNVEPTQNPQTDDVTSYGAQEYPYSPLRNTLDPIDREHKKRRRVKKKRRKVEEGEEDRKEEEEERKEEEGRKEEEDDRKEEGEEVTTTDQPEENELVTARTEEDC